MDNLLKYLPKKIAFEIENLPKDLKKDITEIRIRSGLPICIMCGAKPRFLNVNVNQYDVEAAVKLLCNNSIYAHTNELNNGYISLPFGHRAGVSGNFSGDNLCEFSSVNIRVARQIIGAASSLTDKITGGVLLAGPPASGKTTMLRDLVRQLSNQNFKVSVVDTRGEISAFSSGVIYNDLGLNTDVLFGIDKEKGIEIALRTMSPQYIAFDEIGNKQELLRVFQSVNGGAEILTTAHISGKEQLLGREVTRQLIVSGAVKTVVLLDSKYNGTIIYREELIRDVSG